MTVTVACDDGFMEVLQLLRLDISVKWTKDLFSSATKTSHNLYAIALQETNAGERNASRKLVTVRDMAPDYTDEERGWFTNASVTVPVGKLGWLIGTLQQAHEVVENVARKNRQAA